ncbi:hypothetical protein Leryth_000509 [Lithospermum erythrorhizon]|nr:hypothetical protein Leryth_000509 [Lithospermum erythrorhizon]
MNLNCLSCQIKRTDSDDDLMQRLNPNSKQGKTNHHLRPDIFNRSWSGNLVPRPSRKSSKGCALEASKHDGVNGLPQSHHGLSRVHNSGPADYEPATPRLVRSGGMRRDWSFENVRQIV